MTGTVTGTDRGLAARLVVRQAGFTLDARIDVAAGEIVALLGPNGAGKSTALRALAGLRGLDGGRIALDGQVLDEPAGNRYVPPERRPIGVVFQDLLLFPHLSVLDNVAFGPRCRGVPRRSARDTARHWLERVGLADRAADRPGVLSGGQAQRVALARALAVEPHLLLADEPLSALDARTRLTVRADLAAHLREFGGCAVVVTHDPVDAMVLGDRLVVLEGGAVVQSGSPAEVARHPRTQYVARLVGLNLHRGIGRGSRIDLDGGGTLTLAEPVDGTVFAAFRPQSVAVHLDRPSGSPRNVWPATVAGLERLGEQVRVELDGVPSVAADLTAAAVAELGLGPGVPVWVAVKASDIAAYPSHMPE
ncbi:MAG TPA: ABC transporter ATP-binding protein [Mycobacteriales bacterium]|nr:ABC transporter ATP-binding protein [Mycobacteriales bacterium]